MNLVYSYVVNDAVSRVEKFLADFETLVKAAKHLEGAIRTDSNARF